MAVEIHSDRLIFPEGFSIEFQRTLRVPADDRVWPLPPGVGRLPLFRVEEFSTQVPTAWNERGGVFLPLYQREALWIGFHGRWWHPNAVQVGVGGINALSAESWGRGLNDAPQNYLVCPDQPWIDGINTGEGAIRQFVGTPLGSGLSVERQISGSDERGGLQLRVYRARPGHFPDQPPARPGRPEMPGMASPEL